MPSLITYERKSLTDSQYHALGVYFTKKRQREREKKRENESSSLEQPTTSTETTELNDEEKIDSPPSAKKPTAKERREEIQKDLDDVEKQLEELETTLASLEKQKHELFEELKGLVHNKKHEEKEKQFSTAPSGLPTFTTQQPPGFPPAGEGLPAVSCSQALPKTISRYESALPNNQLPLNFQHRDVHRHFIAGTQSNPSPYPSQPSLNPFVPHDVPRNRQPYLASNTNPETLPPPPPPPPSGQPPPPPSGHLPPPPPPSNQPRPSFSGHLLSSKPRPLLPRYPTLQQASHTPSSLAPHIQGQASSSHGTHFIPSSNKPWPLPLVHPPPPPSGQPPPSLSSHFRPPPSGVFHPPQSVLPSYGQEPRSTPPAIPQSSRSNQPPPPPSGHPPRKKDIWSTSRSRYH
ncbi:protein enabled homolog [Xenia sp. Carnegie-2017]|uniref:protein enabled homolog n=1 Tax=Xenia sp. Carnegie-2017 TaxID=2897299 RepID=UPI001F048205|nr:protein enabled homolog [Xenia sp. Carnegie-2017]